MRSHRDNPLGIQWRQADKIMALDMLKACGVLERAHIPVEIPHPAMNLRIMSPDHTLVGLEKVEVDGIKADDGGIEAKVDLCEDIA